MIINSKEPRVRRRFTVAHELAHYLLHREMVGRGVTENAFYRSDSDLSSWQEMEANRLAAEILMPSDLVRAHAGSTDFAYLASRYQVSEQAMQIRMSLKELPRYI